MRYFEDVAKVGDYVEYFPNVTQFSVKPELSGYNEEQLYNPSKTTLWRVFRNVTGGVEIASSCSVGTLIVEGEAGYTNIVATMTGLANAFTNSKYALKGRAMGSTQSSVRQIQIPRDWEEHFNGCARYPYYDEEYMRDINQIYDNGLVTQEWSDVLLASRELLQSNGKVLFGIRKFSPTLAAFSHARISPNLGAPNTHVNDSVSGNVIPIVGLMPDVLVVDGDGSLENPFRIDI